MDLEMRPSLQGSCEDTVLPRDIQSVGGFWSCTSSGKVGPTLPCSGLATESLSLFVSEISGFGVLVCC